MVESYKKLRKEISIVQILQKLRVLNKVAKKQVKSKDDWKTQSTRNGFKFTDQIGNANDSMSSFSDASQASKV